MKIIFIFILTQLDHSHSKSRGGTRRFYCTRVMVCLAFKLFGPAVTLFFFVKPQSSRQFKKRGEQAEQRRCCHFCHDADPLPATTWGKDWNSSLPLSKIGQCSHMRASFAHAAAWPDLRFVSFQGCTCSPGVAIFMIFCHRGSASGSLSNKPLPLTLFAVIPPALTTPMQSPAIAIVAAILVASVGC